jgi:hypothetical protein
LTSETFIFLDKFDIRLRIAFLPYILVLDKGFYFFVKLMLIFSGFPTSFSSTFTLDLMISMVRFIRALLVVVFFLVFALRVVVFLRVPTFFRVVFRTMDAFAFLIFVFLVFFIMALIFNYGMIEPSLEESVIFLLFIRLRL